MRCSASTSATIAAAPPERYIGDGTAGQVSPRGRAALAQIKDSKRVRGPFVYDQWSAASMTDASPVQNLVRIRLEVVQVLEQMVLVFASNR